MKDEIYKKIVEDFDKMQQLKKHIKTKDIDSYNKKLIKENVDVSSLKDKVLKDQNFHRTYFQVSLGEMKNYTTQFEFIEQNEDLLQDWWHVDQLIQFIKKPVDFNFALNKAKKYIKSNKVFTRRWGYVLFLCGLQKDNTKTSLILNLIKDDNAFYVQMAQAWLICDLCVFNPTEVVDFLKNSKIKYNILGKAVQKICDSFRISEEVKKEVKSLRTKLKEN